MTRILGQLLLGNLAGVMAEDQPGLGRDRVAQRFHPLLQEERHGGVVLADRLPRFVAADPAVVRETGM